MNLNQQHAGSFWSAAFLAAMVQEGGRVESEGQTALPLYDWILTYINL